MAQYILEDRRSIDRAHLSNMLENDNGVPTLEIKLHYAKDSRRRGLKISVYRTLETDFGCSYDIMNDHNGLVHLVDMSRKPSPKIAAQWKSAVESRLDAVAEIALASAKPDWRAVSALFAGGAV